MKIITLAGLSLALFAITGLAVNAIYPALVGWELLASLLACAMVLSLLFIALAYWSPDDANQQAGQPIYRTADGPLIERQTRQIQRVQGVHLKAPAPPAPPVKPKPPTADNWPATVAKHRQSVTSRAQLDARRDYDSTGFAGKRCRTPNPYRPNSAGFALHAIEYTAELERLQHITAEEACQPTRSAASS
jgi:hypothetical protein